MYCHQFQYASVIAPEFRMPANRAFPIVRYELDAFNERNIRAVQLDLGQGQYRWFQLSQVKLFRAPAALASAPYKTSSSLGKFLKTFSLKPF